MPTVPWLPHLDGQHLPSYVLAQLFDALLFLDECHGIATDSMLCERFDMPLEEMEGMMLMLQEMGLVAQRPAFEA